MLIGNYSHIEEGTFPMPFKKLKPGLLVGLSLVLCGSMIAGCSSDAQNQKATPGTTAAPDTSKADEPLKKVTYMMSFNTAEPQREDNIFWKKIEEYTGTDVQITWVPQSGYIDKTAAVIASGEMPQVLAILNPEQYKSGLILNAIRSGLFWELGPYLKDYPNLKPENMNPLTANNFQIGGKIYGVYKSMEIARNGLYFRNDWLKNVGLNTPKTMDDLYNVMKAFTLSDPDKNGKQDTYGLVTDKDDYNLFPIWFGAPNGWGVKEGKLYPAFEHPRYLEAMKFLKKLYDEKLMNQDFTLYNVNKSNDAINAGKGGVFVRSVSTLLKFEKLQDKITKVASIKGPDGNFAAAEDGFAGSFLVPKSSVKTEKELRQLLAFFNKLADRQIQDLFEWGVEGVHFEKKNGVIEQTDRAQFAKDRPGIQFMGLSFKKDVSPGKYDPLTQMLNETSEQNEKIAVGNPATPLTSKTYLERGADLDIILSDANVKFIMGAINEAGWKDAIALWHKNGGDAVIKEYNEDYAKSKR
jgi:putative aldouronate transport system substrate-binding protein